MTDSEDIESWRTVGEVMKQCASKEKLERRIQRNKEEYIINNGRNPKNFSAKRNEICMVEQFNNNKIRKLYTGEESGN